MSVDQSHTPAFSDGIRNAPTYYYANFLLKTVVSISIGILTLIHVANSLARLGKNL